ncbi:hypothetical protein GQ457_09G007400 [Hibiscus cannabinus]
MEAGRIGVLVAGVSQILRFERFLVDFVFNGKSQRIKDILFYTKLRSLAWVKASKDDLNINIDEWWLNPESSLIGTHNPPVLWDFHSADTVNFNIHVAATTNRAGVGGMLRTKGGVIRAIFSRLIQGVGADFAGLVSIKYALDLFIAAVWLGKAGLVVELDSKIILFWLNNPLQRPWYGWNLFGEIDQLTRKIEWIQFCLIPRERNMMATCLANAGIDSSECFKAWW